MASVKLKALINPASHFNLSFSIHRGRHYGKMDFIGCMEYNKCGLTAVRDHEWQHTPESKGKLVVKFTDSGIYQHDAHI